MKVHAAVARALADSGVDSIFGVIGDANMFHLAEFTQGGYGRFVGAVTEGGAVGMADAYARVSGRVGVASVTHGPGAANTVNAIIEAVKAHTPLVLITGDTPARRGHPQKIDLKALFAVTEADYHRTIVAAHVVDDIAMVVARALATGRPVVLDIPMDIQSQQIDYARSKYAQRLDLGSTPDPESMDAALGILASAKRPLILAGRGAVVSGAGPALKELADRLGAPLATTASAKDLFRGHPYDLGLMGTLSPDWAVDVMVKADCIAAFGAGLNILTTVDGDLFRDCAVIHCDTEPGNIGRITPVDVGLRGDAAVTARAMVEQLDAIEFEAGGFRAQELGAGVLDRSPREEFRDRSTETTLDMRTAMIALDEMLPLDKVVVTDAGRFKVAPWRYLHVADPRNFVQTAHWASIGLGTAAAVGAAAARPGIPTVGVCGDGGGMMGLIEFSTAVRHQIPFVLVVLNDNAYGQEFSKFEQHGYRGSQSFVAWPEFAEVATALGGSGVTVRTMEELKAAADLVPELNTPLLIDIRADPNVNPNVP